MALWLTRTGDQERERIALQENIVITGWDQVPDLSYIKTIEEIHQLLNEVYPTAKGNTISNWSRQLWAFRARMMVDDLIIMPSKSHKTFAIGTISGQYHYRSDLALNGRHTRPVQWLLSEVPRNKFKSDLLTSLGSIMSISMIQRNDAEDRVRELLAGNVTMA